MASGANNRDAARVACLPLDCHEDTLRTLFENEPGRTLQDASGFETYVEHAVEQQNLTPSPGYGATDIHELVTFAAGCALRIRYADPLTGTRYDAREPDGSAEQRMLRRPFEQHPELNWYDRNARRFYIASVTSFFESLSRTMQAEIATVLLAPPPADTATAEDCRQHDSPTSNRSAHRCNARHHGRPVRTIQTQQPCSYPVLRDNRHRKPETGLEPPRKESAEKQTVTHRRQTPPHRR